jgi:hypothetical protein
MHDITSYQVLVMSYRTDYVTYTIKLLNYI